MKRAGNLFESIIAYPNIRLAFLKAVRGNQMNPGVLRFCGNLDGNLAGIREKLRTLRVGWGNYCSFLVTDPKLRLISVPPFEQRIMHQALMNVLEPVLERPMIYHSYACRKGKGTYAAVRYAFRQCKGSSHFLKLDVRKYFDSVDHGILKTQLCRLIKDPRVLLLLRDLIDSYALTSGKGLPIGNLTSQYFANLYLAGLDRYILEGLRPRGYCRYMDDFAIWGDSHSALKGMHKKIERYAAEKLALALKPPVFGKPRRGLPFLGFLIRNSGLYLLRKSKLRVSARMRAITADLAAGRISETQAAAQSLSVLAWIRLARTNPFRRTLLESL
jgi:hypothetical protein